MLAWAVAKLHGRGPAASGARRRRSYTAPGRSEDVDRFVVALAEEAHRRLAQLGPQSVANIAWALATLELLGSPAHHAPARAFLTAAASVAKDQLEHYSPQAVANLMWAVVRLEPQRHNRTPQAVASLAVAAALESTRRMQEFSWRDLAGVSVALASRKLRSPEALSFATILVGHTASRCREIAPQALLNIAQSCARLGVDPFAMRPLVDAMSARIMGQGLQLNDVDQRQWEEVLKWCPPTHAVSHYPESGAGSQSQQLPAGFQSGPSGPQGKSAFVVPPGLSATLEGE